MPDSRQVISRCERLCWSAHLVGILFVDLQLDPFEPGFGEVGRHHPRHILDLCQDKHLVVPPPQLDAHFTTCVLISHNRKWSHEWR
jgi:hypothetical protein